MMREIHALRKFARELQEQIDRAPRQFKAQQAKVASREEAVKENAEAIKKLKVALHEKEVTLKATHGQIAKYQKQQSDDVHSKKEYDALQHEIAAAKAKGDALEEEILAAMTELEERTAKAPELDAVVRKTKTDFTAWESGAKDRLAGWNRQIAETQAKLKEAETGVPEMLRTQYDRIVRAMGPEAFAAVREHYCTACRVEITDQNFNDLLMGGFRMCRSCGRILYLPEDAPAGADDDE
jgi:predicted  nucleic acid-binding Zn-ribbon protein